MQQRRLRLGDILDDYCPRERRITNHAVVAMIDEQVKQTRCTTCDADHEYKQARVPASRRRKGAGVLADVADEGPRAVRTDSEPSPVQVMTIEEDPYETADASSAESMDEPVSVAEAIAHEADEPRAVDDDGPVHRPLIRATLPRPEGQGPEWREPEFTARYPGRQGRDIDGNKIGGAGGQRPGRRRSGRGGHPGTGGQRFGGSRQGNARHGGGGHGHQNGNRGNSRGPSRGGDQRGGAGRKRGR
jgi:hypothetical protein